MPVRVKQQSWERGGRGGGHINEPGLHDPRVLYRRRPSRRKGISSLTVTDRALPDVRLLFAQLG